ncbi:MAG: polysaccharide deacetylase family protein [Planctomycetota bacterium]|jgi:peptidoglycan/xylan/chitin deacetylase (PgdA/CDA1 family)
MSDQRVLAVMYHYVRDRAGTSEEGIRGLQRLAFCNQLDQLCARLEPITWPMLYAWHTGKGHLPDSCFLLTFDDGLADHAEVVAPILESRGLRGVFFVPGRLLESGRMESAHQIHLLQARMGDEAFATAVTDWLVRHHDDDNWAGSVDESTARRIYHYESPGRARLKYLLSHTLPIHLRNDMVEALFSSYVGDTQKVARHWYLDSQRVAILDQAGHTIGGHGFDHEAYLRVSPEVQLRDLSRCASILREILGPDLRPFSYPYGSFDDAVAKRCAQAGFAQAFTTRPGWIRRADGGHSLCRVDTINLAAFIEGELSCPLH